MKFDSNIAIVFLLSIFAILTITSSGMSLNDEWMTSAALNQIYQGHQFVFNEGKYGYYANGTMGAYMEWRYNRLMYPITLPIMALPIMFLFGAADSTFRLVILVIWGICGLLAFILVFKKVHGDKKGHFTRRDYYTIAALGIFTAAVVVNRFLYTPFPFSGPWVPGEVVALTMTNILLFGLLAATVFAITKEIWNDTVTQYVTTGIAMVCSSSIFWATTTKDHVLTMLMVAAVALCYIKYYKTDKTCFVVCSSVISGLLMWARPEIGIGMLISSVIVPAYHAREKGQLLKIVTVSCLCIAISLIPFFANNLVSTGSLWQTPFMAANRGYNDYISYSYYTRMNLVPDTMGNVGMDIIRTFVGPSSGAVGLLAIMPLVVFIPFGLWRTRRVTDIEMILLISAIASIAIHIYKGTILFQQADFGIFPDLRYFTTIYIPLTLVSLSMTFRSFDINIKKVLKNTMVMALAATVLTLGLIIVFVVEFSVQAHFNMLFSLISMAAVGGATVMLVNDIRNKTKYAGNIVIPLLVSIPFAWNFITTFLYNAIKISGYPMLLPLSEFIYNLIF